MTAYATGYRAGVDCYEPCPAAPEPWSPQRRALTGPDSVLEHRLRTVRADDGSARFDIEADRVVVKDEPPMPHGLTVARLHTPRAKVDRASQPAP